MRAASSRLTMAQSMDPIPLVRVAESVVCAEAVHHERDFGHVDIAGHVRDHAGGFGIVFGRRDGIRRYRPSNYRIAHVGNATRVSISEFSITTLA